MGILIVKPGIFTTVQDLGRNGFRRFGINPGGVMDRSAARIANILVGNADDTAVLEMHYPAAEILFQNNCEFAIGGAGFTPELDGEKLDNWRPYTAESGSSLRFTDKVLGNRAYLAIRGGIEVERWLGSSATNLAAAVGGFKGRKLAVGDQLSIAPADARTVSARATAAPSLIPRYSRFPTVRITDGAEYGQLTAVGKQLLETQNFTISNNSDRMGFRLIGDPIALESPLEMISSPVSFGSIQLWPDGQVIVLMADHQTSGGYPRIAHIVDTDLPLIAQLSGGDKVGFHMVTHAEAEAINEQFERELALFRVGCGIIRSN